MTGAPPTARAIVLFAHGARDARWAEPLHALAACLRREPGVTVAQAYLELMQPGLADAIGALARDGHRRIEVLPVFWSAGGHVLRDLPLQLQAACAPFPGLSVSVLPVLSALPGVLEAIARGALEAAGHAPAGNLSEESGKC